MMRSPPPPPEPFDPDLSSIKLIFSGYFQYWHWVCFWPGQCYWKGGVITEK